MAPLRWTTVPRRCNEVTEEMIRATSADRALFGRARPAEVRRVSSLTLRAVESARLLWGTGREVRWGCGPKLVIRRRTEAGAWPKLLTSGATMGRRLIVSSTLIDLRRSRPPPLKAMERRPAARNGREAVNAAAS